MTEDPSVLLFRQVNPQHLKDEGGPNSVAFSPTPKDREQLSVDDSRLTSAENAHVHFTTNLGFASAGTWAVSAMEVEAVGTLTWRNDPITDVDPLKCNDAHCVIDFTNVTSKGAKKRVAQTLAIHATVRRRLWP